jgi:Fe2+ transport system protein B
MSSTKEIMEASCTCGHSRMAHDSIMKCCWHCNCSQFRSHVIELKRQGQSQKMSMIEVTINYIIGFILAIVVNWAIMVLIFKIPFTWGNSFWMTIIFTIISVARSYAVRRFFNWIHVRRGHALR